MKIEFVIKGVSGNNIVNNNKIKQKKKKKRPFE